MMKDPIVIIGLGEIGSVFARGLLRIGHPVFPVNRDIDMKTAAAHYPSPAMVLVAVAESDIHDVLEQLPSAWHAKAALLQNELLPRDWQSTALHNPTIASIWFEKKKGQDVKVLLPSPAYGPHSELLVEAMAAMEIPARVCIDFPSMVYELVRKNLYILTINIAGLITKGTVCDLWRNHRDLAESVASEVIQIQEALAHTQYSKSKMMDGLVEALNADPDHKCLGRTAPVRLVRTLAIAEELGIATPMLIEIRARLRQA